MISEERDEKAYQAIPLKTRILIRLVIFLVKKLYKHLQPLGLSPYFSISEREEDEFSLDFEEEEEELLQ